MTPKKVFITGSGSGLGKQAAICLARRGHTVYASVHYENQIAELEEIASSEHLNLSAFCFDITNKKDRNLIFSYDIDVFIANAAIGDSGSVSEVPVDFIREVFETNVFSNLELIQLVLRRMITQKHVGRIIFLSSLAGRIPAPFLSPYCASKFALEAFGTCLRQEMKLLNFAKIEVSLIEPGAFATGFNKENNEKKYVWMKHFSYFDFMLEKLQRIEEKLWNFIEIKPYTSIIRQYIRVVEDSHLKARYRAPWYHSLVIQLARILGF